MTASGFLFLILGILVTLYISMRKSLGSSVLPWILFFYHLLIALYFWHYSLSHNADSLGYFHAIGTRDSFGTGTSFIEWLINRLHSLFGASYLDYFFLFHIFGFLGLCTLYRIFKEVHFFNTDIQLSRLQIILLFLPNLNFWTVAIGKDSLIFFAITLTLWSMIALKKRIPYFIVGGILIFLIRPHIAGFMLVASFMALFWGPGISLRWKVLGTLVSAGAMFALFPFIQDFVGLEELSIQSVNTYLQSRQGQYLSYGSSINISQLSFPMKLLAFLYRPFFFDANSVTGLIVSIEHLFHIYLVYLTFSKHMFSIFWSFRYSFFMRFNLFFFAIVTI